MQDAEQKTEATTAAADTTGAASTETKAEAKGDPVVINYYDWDIPDQKFIDDFNAANPDIQVVAHSIPANGERLTKLDILAMSGGDMDVMPISDGDQLPVLNPVCWLHWMIYCKRRRRYGQVFWKICNLGTV